jgi:hypothetical protein
MFYMIYPSAEISHWKWLTTSTTKQCYFTVLYIIIYNSMYNSF